MRPQASAETVALATKKAVPSGDMPSIFRSQVLPGAGSPAAAAADQPHDHEQDDGADCGINDLGNDARAQMDAEFRKQQARDESAGDTDQDVADDAKAGAADDLAGQPARDQADEQNDDNALVGQDHEASPRLHGRPPRAGPAKTYPQSAG